MNKSKSDKIDILSLQLLDGAMGTELMKLGWAGDSALENWAVEHPNVVKSVHEAYISAGSEVIYTCTFGANRIRLGSYGLEDRVSAFNSDLIAIAKSAVSRKSKVLIAGNIGPTGETINANDQSVVNQLIDVFSEQIESLVSAGVDMLAIESTGSIIEATSALKVARSICDLPVIVTMAFGEDCMTLDGLSDPETVCRELQAIGATSIGCNCSPGGDNMWRVINRMKKVAEVPLIAKPSAGIPTISNGQSVYPLSPVDFVFLCQQLMDGGATIVGGCCGTTPEYIKKLSISLGKQV